MSKRLLDIQLGRLRQQIQKQSDQLDLIQNRNREREQQLRKNLATIELAMDQLIEGVGEYKESIEKEAKRGMKKLEDENARLRKQVASAGKGVEAVEAVGLEKAKTLAIFDAILFAIDNWSTDGQIAPDVLLACQSVLFPTVYERVMNGNKDYYVEKVPVAALEIVRRGRELVRHIREVSDQSLVDPDTWKEHASMVHQWWVGDALPLIYGARDPDWDSDEPFSLVEMEEWRDMPASRALHFPLIFDGMELVSRFNEEIRETTGLPEFTRTTVSTRLEP
jgi:hypothetical protein